MRTTWNQLWFVDDDNENYDDNDDDEMKQKLEQLFIKRGTTSKLKDLHWWRPPKMTHYGIFFKKTTVIKGFLKSLKI